MARTANKRPRDHRDIKRRPHRVAKAKRERDAAEAGLAVEFNYCPVPAKDSSLAKGRGWARPEDRKFVISEIVKLVAYRVILLMPQFLIRRFVRLKS